jgi:hypothetical protein
MVTPLTLPVPRLGLLLADWSSPVKMEHAFLTASNASATTIAEERRALRELPARRLSAQVTTMTRVAGERLRMAMRRLATGRQPWPLWQDARPITADYTYGSPKIIPIDTTYARFYVGARVWVWDQVEGEAANAELCTITAKTDSQITVSSTVYSRAVGRGMVAPSIDLDLHLESGSQALTGYYHSAGVQLDEYAGLSCYPLLDSYPPTGFTLKDGDPILEVDPDWALEVRRGIVREGYAQRIGRAEHRYGVGETRETISFTMTAMNRAEAWEIMRFMDSLQGRLRPFWIVAPEERYVIVGSGVGYIDVLALDSHATDIDTIENVAIVEPGGGVPVILEITSHADNGSTWRLGTSTGFSLPSQVARASDVYHVRLADDRWTESWITDTVCQVSINCVQLRNEGVVEAVGMPSEF